MLIKKRVTIKEVAQAAGVSAQTVSRVVNEHPDVSPETRERVQSVIVRMGYSPNALARGLIRGRTHTLGVVGYGLSYYGPARVLTGIEGRANELGYSLILSLLREPESTGGAEVYQNLLDHQVDGMIWAVPEIGDNRAWVMDLAGQPPLPAAFINMQPAGGLAVAAVDNRAGGRLAVEHLLSQGCRRVGIIAGPDAWWESRQREQGWREALQAAGHTGLDDLKTAGDWYPASGAKGLEELLHRCPDLDGVFVCNDPMAVGALQAARRLNRRVPHDLAIVGFDDVPEAAFFDPALSSVRQPLAELGGQAVDLLHRVLENESASQEPCWLDPQLVIRESSLHHTHPHSPTPGDSPAKNHSHPSEGDLL